ncbi:ABC transporter permease [Kiloniella sp. EL199]|uniref:ABC transporter permease n=1 Tax=Kiloniella sp. EL199 TaxID=2107581 RepID=UPI000EA10C3F|nr:ABC transporter permease [Kiloniella sp. EL199]
MTFLSETHSPVFHKILNREYFVYYALILVIAFFAVVLSETAFLSTPNFMNIIRQTTPITVMAVGMTFALAVGHIDLSVGSVVALSALVCGLLVDIVPWPVAVFAGLSAGMLVGLINGVLTEWLKVSSLLITLGSMGVISGIARVITNLESIPITNDSFTYIFGSGSFGPVSVMFIWTLFALVLGWVFLSKTRFGSHLLAVGGNPTASRALGINVVKVKITAMVIAGGAAAMAGMLYAGRLHGARYSLGEADLLTVIAAVAIGGTSLFGGRASVAGAVVGSWLMGVINNGLILWGFSTNEQIIARGLILIVAVAIGVKEDRR